jgi:hypothetical protein
MSVVVIEAELPSGCWVDYVQLDPVNHPQSLRLQRFSFVAIVKTLERVSFESNVRNPSPIQPWLALACMPYARHAEIVARRLARFRRLNRAVYRIKRWAARHRRKRRHG